MAVYTHGTGGINDIANGVCMRSDVHRCFDGLGFVIYPEGSSFLTYVIDGGEADFAPLLHWRLLEVPDRVFPELLYARFAYAIIKTALTTQGLFNPVPPNEAVINILSDDSLDLFHASGSADTSEVDEDCSYALDDDTLAATSYATFPHLREEREHSTDHHYNTLILHPETPRMRRLMEDYKRQNPQVSQRSGATAASPDMGDAGEDDAEENVPVDFFDELVAPASIPIHPPTVDTA
ncbi:hypothetical protein C8T65DRAFT_827222 [Cerioporus squamosus]|nr:hypothetical protein C8T65DRAFT_827222 [Cerioporus squamosus]